MAADPAGHLLPGRRQQEPLGLAVPKGSARHSRLLMALHSRHSMHSRTPFAGVTGDTARIAQLTAVVGCHKHDDQEAEGAVGGAVSRVEHALDDGKGAHVGVDGGVLDAEGEGEQKHPAAEEGACTHAHTGVVVVGGGVWWWWRRQQWWRWRQRRRWWWWRGTAGPSRPR